MSSGENNPKKGFVTLAAVNASLGFAHYGYVFTIFNSIQILLQNFIFPNASTSEYSLIASSPNIGGALGAILTEMISRKLGRRKTMILSDLISIVGVLLTMSLNFAPMVIGRILTGFTAGVASVIVPIYVSEISREPLRGPLGCIPVISQSSGVLVGFLIGLAVPTFISSGMTELGCRIMLAVPALLNLLRIINLLLFFSFETPFYLVQTSQEEQAKDSLKLLHDPEQTDDRYQSLIFERDYMYEQESISFSDLLQPKYRSVFLMGVFLALMQQFVGGNTVPTFSNLIFSEGSGSLDSSLPLVLTTILGVFNVLFSALVIPLMKYFGRRFFIVYMMISLLLVNAGIALISYLDSIGNWGAKILVLSWIAAYSLSIGTVLFLYLAETLPEVAVGIAILVNWVGAFIVNQVFLGFTRTIGYAGIFTIYAGFSLLVYLVGSFFMIETKGKSRLEILKQSIGSNGEKETILSS